MAKPKGRSGKSRVKKNVPAGIAYILATFNNTKVSFTDPQGNVIAWSNAGVVGFKGSRKSTPFAATQIATKLAKDLITIGAKLIEVNLQGPGSGRDSVVRAFQASGLAVTLLRDVTPLPHNGCRPPKKRRV